VELEPDLSGPGTGFTSSIRVGMPVLVLVRVNEDQAETGSEPEPEIGEGWGGGWRTGPSSPWG
jgi:hypothetical protein